MPNPNATLVQFSDALSALASDAHGFLAEIRDRDGRRLSGVLWKPNAVVVSERDEGRIDDGRPAGLPHPARHALE